MGSRLRPGTVKQDPNMMPQQLGNVPNMMQPESQQIGTPDHRQYRIDQILGQQPQAMPAEPMMNAQVMPNNPRRRLFRGGRY